MAIPVVGYEDYLIYPDGKVFSTKSNKFLKPNITPQGYKSVELFNNNGSKRLLIHRLVAQAFIPNPENFPQVNHKDENPSNNSMDNLEWCTAKYNMNYGNGAITRHQKIDYTAEVFKRIGRENGKSVCRPVEQYSLAGEFIARYNSAKEAIRKLSLSNAHISDCCKGKRKSSNGFMWKYERGNDLSLSQY